MEVASLLGRIFLLGSRLSMALMVIGLAVSLAGRSYVSPSEVVRYWTKGDTASEFWGQVGKQGTGHWFLSSLPAGDAVGMMGIAVLTAALLAGLAVLLASFVAKDGRDRLYAALTLLAMVIVLLSALGFIR